MAAFNRIIIVGNLTRDPDYKQLSSGQAVSRLSIASNRQFKNRQTGDMVQEVCYVDVDVWGAQAESCRQYLQKGRPVLIEGRLKFDSWDDANGQKRSKHSIVADRVVFLNAGAQAETSESVEKNEEVGGLNPNNPAERELMDQISNIKNRTQARAAGQAVEAPQFEAAKLKKKPKIEPAQEAATGGEIDFNDAPPFQDDLPF